MSMDKNTRSELLKKVETQQTQIEKYQTKLRDLIAAYKSVVKEKEALEASVKALSALQSKPQQPPKPEDEPLKSEEHTESSFSDPLREKDASQAATEEIEQLRDQLATLTLSLTTLGEEKTRTEAKYQAEKKVIKQEQEVLQEKLDKETEKFQRLSSDLRAEVAEWRSQVLVQQHERDRERQENNTKIRDLQKQITQDKAAIETLENQLEDTKELLMEAKQLGPEVSVAYEDRISGLSKELKVVRERLKHSEEDAKKPSPLLLQLQEEMAEMKAQHRISVQREQACAKDAEETLRQRDEQAEERVASLEAKLSELSEMVGNYERLRFQDQTSIQKYKERVAQLDMENTALARAAHKGTSLEPEDDEDDSNLDVQALVEKIMRIKSRLKLANDRSEKPVDIEELLQTGKLSEIGKQDDENIHQRCREEYDQLKEEFERYKLRAQSILKNKSSTKETGSKEIDTLKAQISELKERLRQNLDDQEQTNLSHKKASDDLRKTITALQERHQQELSSQEGEHKSKLAELELQIKKHRERTIALLSEKDSELETLKSKAGHFESHYVHSLRRLTTQRSVDSDEAAPPFQAPQSLVEQEEMLSELIKKTSVGTHASGTTETSLLHFAEEQARREVEMNMLRKQKRSLEGALRDLQRTGALKDEVNHEKIESLEDQVRRLQRLTSKEDAANIEYLKNVVYQFMICQDSDGKKAMLNAIATILQFSSREKSKVKSLLSSGWWGGGSHSTKDRTSRK